MPEKYNGTSPAYHKWRTDRQQLAEQQSVNAQQLIGIPSRVDGNTERTALIDLCERVQHHGFAVYEWQDQPVEIASQVRQLHLYLQLTHHDDGVVNDQEHLALLQDASGTPRGRFIPYTSRAMGWHTDGYYNDQTQTLRCFTLHCIQQAASGGCLTLMDYELLYIALIDEDPELISLLCHPEAMTLPANKDDIGHDRPDRHASVFYWHGDGSLGARFTTRTKNIQWRTEETRQAAERAAAVLNELSHWQQTVRLQSGQGVITRNILHRREAFTDDTNCEPRQMLRGRYLQLPTTA